MARFAVSVGGTNVGTRTRELPAYARVGRYGGNEIILDHPRVPLTWAEIRWWPALEGTPGEWRWRQLHDAGRLEEVATRRPNGWRALVGRRTRIDFDGETFVALADSSAPRAFLHDLRTGEDLVDAACAACVLVDAAGNLCDPDTGQLLRDGELREVVDDACRIRWVRVHVPSAQPRTENPVLDLSRDAWILEIATDRSWARLSARDPARVASLVIEGAQARLLRIYAEARNAAPDGGWLTGHEALDRWHALGGHEADAQRMTTLRHRTWQRLRTLGVVGEGNAVFEEATAGREHRFRLRRKGSDEVCVLANSG